MRHTLAIGFTVVSGLRVACKVRCVEWAVPVELYHCLVLIAVDKYATTAVHDDVCFAPDFCAELLMPNAQNSKRAKDWP